jgi:hypothetical protein
MSWLRTKEVKKPNNIEIVYNFIGFVYSGDEDLTKLSKFLSKNIQTDTTDTNNSKANHNSLREYTDFFGIYHRKSRNYIDNFTLNETNIRFDKEKFYINTIGKIKIFDGKFGFYKLMNFTEQFILSLDENNNILKLENISNLRFLKFVF